jgi:hypothetical protein
MVVQVGIGRLEKREGCEYVITMESWTNVGVHTYISESSLFVPSREVVSYRSLVIVGQRSA